MSRAETRRERIIRSFWTEEKLERAFSAYEPFLDDYLEKRWDDSPLLEDLEPSEMETKSKVAATLNIANDDYKNMLVFDQDATYSDPFELLSYLVTLGNDEGARVLDASENWVMDMDDRKLDVETGEYHHVSDTHYEVLVEDADFYFAGPKYFAHERLDSMNTNRL